MEKLKEDLKKFILNCLKIKTHDESATQFPLKGKLKQFSYYASFGKGAFAYVPWLGFFAFNQIVTKGIYPVILYNTKSSNNNFEICYGISATSAPNIPWDKKYIQDLQHSNTPKYADSFVRKSYTINSIEEFELNLEDIMQQINLILNDFEEQFSNNNFKKNEQIIEPITYNKEVDNMNMTLNQILYGPPGTGKTYSVKKYIDKIIGGNPGLKTDSEEQRISDTVKSLNWYSVIALSMYRNGKNNKYKVTNMQYQKLIKAFAQVRGINKLRAIIWGQLQAHTSTTSNTVNCERRLAPFIFNKSEDSDWYLTEEGIKFVEENLSEQLELLDAKNKTREKEDFYKFITFHQSYSYEEFVEGIKPVISDDEEYNTISYEYNKGIFKEICQKANSDPDNNYLLIIDEINRGNISKIFGELITLIENDKRVTPNGDMNFENTQVQNNQLLVTLPYTKSKFGVPQNLYILGTMNTSDRSIASIDIALRRRFKFKEMMPQPKLVADFGIGFNKIFENLNNKIKLLLDRDHQIGHSYFINTKYNNENENNNNIETLKEIWFSEILPLLNEYFYCDWEKLKLIAPGFIKKLDVPETLKNECEDSIYEFKTFDEVVDFKNALIQEKFLDN